MARKSGPRNGPKETPERPEEIPEDSRTESMPGEAASPDPSEGDAERLEEGASIAPMDAQAEEQGGALPADGSGAMPMEPRGAEDDPGEIGGAGVPDVSPSDPEGVSSETSHESDRPSSRDDGAADEPVPESAGIMSPTMSEEPTGQSPTAADSRYDNYGPDAEKASDDVTAAPPGSPVAAFESSDESTPPRRSGFAALVLGGLVAAALGFGAAWLSQGRVDPTRLPVDLDERLAALEARPLADDTPVQSLASRLSDLETRLTAQEEAPDAAAADLAPIREEIDQSLSDIRAQVAELEERIAALETRPAPPQGVEAPLGSLAVNGDDQATGEAPPVDTDALRQEVIADLEPRLSGLEQAQAELQAAVSGNTETLESLQGRLDEAESARAAAEEEARAATEAAATAEEQARARAALVSVNAALDAGEPFPEALSTLADTGVDVPGALSQVADEGASTLSALRDRFPDAARSALAAARDEGFLDEGNGVFDFLRGQLSVRSVTPREGEDPDAVLSRAEANLAQGRLAAALSEVESLPDPVRAAMADWIERARTRAEAETALAGLRDELPDVSPAD